MFPYDRLDIRHSVIRLEFIFFIERQVFALVFRLYWWVSLLIAVSGGH